MKKFMSILVVSAVLVAVSASGVIAVETRSVVKGSFRNIYPDAVVVAKDIGNMVSQVPLTKSPYVKSYQDEHERFIIGAIEYSKDYCADKSDYAIADNFEVHTALVNTNDYVAVYTSNFNVICFNLPKATPALTKKK